MTFRQGHKTEKVMFTDDEVETLKWHDCSLHGIAFVSSRNEVRFDLDYVEEWPGPNQEDFRIAPATLVFRGVTEISCAVSPIGCEVWVREIRFSEQPTLPARAQRTASIETTGGVIRIEYDSKCLYFRSAALKVRPPEQRLSFEQRGRVRFDLP